MWNIFTATEPDPCQTHQQEPTTWLQTLPNAKFVRPYHGCHQSLLFIYLYQSRHHKKYIRIFFRTARTACFSNQAWRVLTITLRADVLDRVKFWFCSWFWLRDLFMYSVLSVFTSSPVSMPACLTSAITFADAISNSKFNNRNAGCRPDNLTLRYLRRVPSFAVRATSHIASTQCVCN